MNPTIERQNLSKRELSELLAFENDEVIRLDDDGSWIPSIEGPDSNSSPRTPKVMADQHLDILNSTTGFKTKTIYAGDIQNVFSAVDIFQVIKQKFADESGAHRIELPQDNKVTSVSRICSPSKREQTFRRSIVMEAFDESDTSLESSCHLIKPMDNPSQTDGLYDDLIIS